MTDPDSVIRAALEPERGAPCLTCSFQAEDMVVLDVVRRLCPQIPVLFLETGYHFAETYVYRDRMAQAWNLNLVNLRAESSVAEQESAFGILYQTQPDRCCQIRKVEPLFRGLAQYEVWFTGLRREQSPTRANLQPMEDHRLPSGKPILKVSPLADWTSKDVWSYMAVNEIPHLPLYDQGYASIGCQPCTRAVPDGQEIRAGRWWWELPEQKECGLHVVDGRLVPTKSLR